MNRISDDLWIADIQDVKTKSLDVDVVVTVCQDRVDDNISCDYAHFNMADGPSTNGMYGGDCSYETFERATDYVVENLMNGEEVLVHCHVGQSRSAAVCIAALAVVENITFDEAYTEVKGARSLINPIKLLEDHAKAYIKAK